MDNSALALESMGFNLPYNIEAEQAILGTAIIEKNAMSDIMTGTKTEYFYSKQNSEVFNVLTKLYTASTPIDAITVLNSVIEANVFESQEAAKTYIYTIASTVPSLGNLEAYIKIVYEKYLVRRLMLVSKEILEQATGAEDADILLESAEQKIYEVRSGIDQSAMQSIDAVLIETLNNLEKISGADKEKYQGIPTGYKYIDKLLTGLGKSDLVILAARPGMGKTSFALNIATNVAKRDIPVAIFSLEMTKEQLASRLLSSEAAVGSMAMRTGELDSQEWARIANNANIMSNMPIYLDDTSSITIPEIKAKVRRINQNRNTQDIGLIIIDYLQLMNSGKRTENRVQEISTITRNLKIMAKELNVPVVTLSQLSRATERGSSNHRPQLSDLRDSGSIEQDADSVLFLIREGYYKGDAEGEVDDTAATCIIAKNRHGEVGDVQLSWDGEHTRFIDIEYRYEND